MTTTHKFPSQGSSKLIVDLVIKSGKSPANPRIFTEVVEFGIALLEGGNQGHFFLTARLEKISTRPERRDRPVLLLEMRWETLSRISEVLSNRLDSFLGRVNLSWKSTGVLGFMI